MAGGIRKTIRRQRNAWHGMAMMLLAGCAPSFDPASDSESLSRLPTIASAPTDDASVHDLGVVLARGQTITHQFTLNNPSAQPLPILGAEPLTPCCSSIGPLPESVPARGSIDIPITFKPGSQTGRRQVTFVVRTGDSANPTRLFTLLASLVPEVEVELLDNSDTSLLLGQTGKQRLRVTCRRAGDEGRGAPTKVQGEAILAATFAGPSVEDSHPDGTIETVRQIDVTLPAESSIGAKRAQLEFTWPNGAAHIHTLGWVVKPCIDATPSAFVLAHGDVSQTTRTIVLTAQDRPFRVRSIEGAILARPCDFQEGFARTHILKPTFTDLTSTGAGTSDLVITTDHPLQPVVFVSILSLSPSGGDK